MHKVAHKNSHYSDYDFKSRKREFHDFKNRECFAIAATDHCSRRQHWWPKIRAIHSEDDKEFVRFLGRELGKMCYDVFDDGESNLDGLRGCRLVVVVVSKKFLTTEACMAEFMLVMTDPSCLCLFYELNVEEFLNQSNLAKWRKVWESWPQGIQVSDVEAAWRQLMPEGRTLDCSTLADGNTIEFMKIIAQTISSTFIPLQVHWSQQTRCIQGKTVLCEEVDKCYFKGPLCDENVRVLGLHGMWSVGKTSLAKALCDFYSTEFQGRVYHAELLKKSSHLQLMKDLLRNLLGAKQDFLEQNLTGVGQFQKLRAVTLLTLEERKIEMPSLCRIFAEKVAKDSEAHVYAVCERLRGADLSNMLNHGADVIERVCFEHCFFEDPGYILDLSNCKCLQVLRLLNVWCHPRLEVYLGHSKLLTLEISSIRNPVIVTGDLPCVRCFSCLDIMVSGNKFPPVENLEVLGINMSSADGFTLQDFCGECEPEVLRLIHNRSRMLPQFFSRLRELTLFDVDLYTLGGNILSNLHNLRTLHVQGMDGLESLDTESMSRLQEVHVMKCSNLSKLQLPAGMWLKHCCIWPCDKLEKITVCDGSVNLEAPVDDDEEILSKSR